MAFKLEERLIAWRIYCIVRIRMREGGHVVSKIIALFALGSSHFSRHSRFTHLYIPLHPVGLHLRTCCNVQTRNIKGYLRTCFSARRAVCTPNGHILTYSACIS